MSSSAFMVGEPYTHNKDGAIHSVFVEYNGRFFVRLDAVKNFNPTNYRHEIRLQLEADARLEALQSASTRYLQENEWQTSEFDNSINDISRLKIQTAFVSWGEVWLGKFNLYGDERKQEYKLVRYDEDMPIYNFSYSFILPRYDEIIEASIDARDKSEYKGAKIDMVAVDTIQTHINAEQGISLFWS